LNTCQVFDIPDISGVHVFLQGSAFPGFLVRSRARQRIRFEKSMSGLDFIAKACILISLGHFQLFFIDI
jgi:hypothetical protein